MNILPIQPYAFSALNIYSLRAFHPDPEHGTLFGPSLESGDLNLPSRRIIDGESALDLKLFFVLALSETSDYWHLCSSRGLERPYPLPSPDQKGTPWFLDEYQQGNVEGALGRAVFSTRDPVRRVEADLCSPPYYRYSFSIESSAARFTQSIRVGDHDDSVLTDHFSAEIREIPFKNAWKLAMGLSTAIYSSGQYDVDGELGPLKFRQGELGKWVEVARKKGRFAAPAFDPASHGEISLTSSLLVFEDPETASRSPVAAVRLRPVSLTMWNMDVMLRRSPLCARRLMPLAPKLRRLIWNPIFDRIFAKRPRMLGKQGG
jgi:hypothetical protein